MLKWHLTFVAGGLQMSSIAARLQTLSAGRPPTRKVLQIER